MKSRFFVKLLLLSVLFGVVFMGYSASAQAQLSLELMGQFGGEAIYLKKERYGDPIFDIGGGLEAAVLFRFEQGFAVGLNFNWITSGQRLTRKELTKGTDSRNIRVHHPSIGLAVRYAPMDIFEWGAWLNYGFGSAKMEFSPAIKSLIGKESFEWSLQSVNIGTTALFAWQVKPSDFYILAGGSVFAVFSRMFSEGKSEYGDGGMTSVGFMINFGARYDIFFEGLSK